MNQFNSHLDPSIPAPPTESSRDKFERIVSLLGPPAARGDRFAIFNGDCIDLMARMPSGCVDLSFTSPPYNIGKEYESILPLAGYLEWCADWINELYRISRSDGAFALNVGYISIPERARSIPIPYLLWDRIPFFLQQEIVWNYGAGVAARKALSPRNEKLLWYVKDPDKYCFNLDDIRDPNVAYPNQKKNGKLRCNTLGKNPSDVWQIAKVTSGKGRASKERTPHPAQFPVDLCERVIKGFSSKDGLIIDPFLGSGSSAEAAVKNDRFAIGFEIRKDYCKFAAERIHEAESALEAKLI
ncbi:DNA-methyltransferase [Stenotrophomonas maltophilia]|uniref:DNA-methyltransferase n=1 Tax=Stenotrophomonas maltophilia TaxID=40324 RepID=UPI0021C7BF98|nr:site-specific DNA-methyltransferase [Stenotrophomonas maltophilia]MCU1025969.1 site-specific DNA-methyltransferase [Stenotrophomonas maltophilia]